MDAQQYLIDFWLVPFILILVPFMLAVLRGYISKFELKVSTALSACAALVAHLSLLF